MFATISLAPINDPIFDPPTVFTPSVAAVNITFVFDGPGTYSVTQSSFEQPCVPLEGGFDTGIIHGSLIGNSTQALLTLGTIGEIVWFFSRPTPPALCDSSTVGAINPPTTGDQTFNDFLLNANSAGLNNITATEHKSASPASATSIGLSPLATVTQSNQSNGYSISPMGAMIGGAIGGIIVVVVALAALLFALRSRQSRQTFTQRRSILALDLSADFTPGWNPPLTPGLRHLRTEPLIWNKPTSYAQL